MLAEEGPAAVWQGPVRTRSVWSEYTLEGEMRTFQKHRQDMNSSSVLEKATGAMGWVPRGLKIF